MYIDFFDVRVGGFADALADRAWVDDCIGDGCRRIRCEVEGFGEFFGERSACSCVRILGERLDGPRNDMIVRVLRFQRAIILSKVKKICLEGFPPGWRVYLRSTAVRLYRGWPGAR